MAIERNTHITQSGDYISLHDLLLLCVGKWKWFLISILFFIGTAVIYYLRTIPVYTRSTLLLIKTDNKKGGSSLSEYNTFEDIGLFSTNANVNNEIISIQSPDLLLEVIRRLNLDVNYQSDGKFHKETLYGTNLPVNVAFSKLSYNDFCSLTLKFREDGKFELSDFIINGVQSDEENVVLTTVGKEVKTPVGKLIVTLSENQAKPTPGEKIYVSRVGLLSCIGSCKGNLQVKLEDDKSTILNITYNDVSIQRAEDFLNTLISVYNENWVKDRNQIAVSTSQFINERLKVIESELGNVDSDISSYKSTNLIPDVDAASKMYMNTANQANVQITDLNNQLYMARYIKEHVNSKNNKDQLLPANSGIGNSAIEQQIKEYNTKQLQRNSLVANSSEENPLVIDIDKQLGEMRSAIVSSIDNQVNTLNTQIRGLQGIQGTSTSRLSSNPKQAKYLLSVERQQKVKESLYLFLLQKREENELSQAFTAYNTRIIMSPTGNLSPTTPNRTTILLSAFILALLVPMIIIYFRENSNTKVRGRKDIERLTIPFIGEVPLYGRQKVRYPWQKEEKENFKILVKPQSRNIINEAFRVVRTNLEFMSDIDEKQKVIMVTSVNPGSGKTFVTMNLAACYAIKNKRVAVIDLDMRRASLSGYVSNPKIGISDYLNGRCTDWHSIKVSVKDYSCLDVIPTGTIPPNPAELLFSPHLATMLEELRQEYDIVFLDCPPIEIVADASVVSKYADRTVFIIRAGLMEREMLPVVESYYNDQKFHNMSVLLNGTTAAGSRYGYHRYGYHYGYAYGYGSKTYGGYTKE